MNKYYYLLKNDEEKIMILISAENVYPNKDSAYPNEVYKFYHVNKIIVNVDDDKYKDIIKNGANKSRITLDKHKLINWIFEG